MTIANVRCAGHPGDDGYYAEDGTWLSGLPKLPPCGWKGERFPNVEMWLRAPTITDLARLVISPEYEAAATKKPCPRCGGRVELIKAGP